MPWKECVVRSEREAFIDEWVRSSRAMTELCAVYGVSRTTGYRFVRRFEAEGRAGLADRSHAPHTCPHRTPARLERLVVRTRERFPSWGGKKLQAWLARHAPGVAVPARSTIDAICARHALVRARRRRVRTAPSARPLTGATAPNMVWCTDYKGWFRLGNGQRCDPLTITDRYSRWLVSCTALPAIGGPAARAAFVAAFRTHGLPEVIRSDNGVPFASTGLAGLSRLSVWWLQLGIRPERIQPGHPEQNGAHERPHEPLDLAVPATRYQPSPRPYPARLPPWAYVPGVAVRHVMSSGHVKWHGRPIFVGEALAGTDVGFEPVGDGTWRVLLGTYPLGIFDADLGGIRGAPAPP